MAILFFIPVRELRFRAIFFENFILEIKCIANKTILSAINSGWLSYMKIESKGLEYQSSNYVQIYTV